MKSLHHFLYIIFPILNTVRCNIGDTDFWQPNLEDPYSDVRNICGNTILTCSQWRNDTLYGTVDSCCLPCECSVDCLASGTCCPDYVIPDAVNERQTLDGESVYYTKNNERCTSTEIILNPFLEPINVQEYLLVQACGSVNASPNVRYRCEHPSQLRVLDMRPVYSPNSGLNYRNIFCALCNDQAESSLIPWQDAAVCHDHMALGSLFPKELPGNVTFIDYVSSRLRTALFWTQPTLNSVARKACVSRNRVISHCTGYIYTPALRELCRDFDQIPVRSSDKIYRNIFCFACSRDMPMAAQSTNLSCSTVTEERSSPRVSIYMNIDLYVNGDDTTRPVLEEPSLCNRGELYIAVSRISKNAGRNNTLTQDTPNALPPSKDYSFS